MSFANGIKCRDSASGSCLRRQHALRASPVVVVLGARQTGKTTLVRSLPRAERPYLTLDDFDLRVQAAADPEAVVDRAPSLIIDEVQRVRGLLIAVKRAVDRDSKRRPGRFVLTGSANLLMMEQIGETLAGRAVYVTLWLFARRERLGLGRAGLWSELVSARWAKWRDVIDEHAGPQEDWRASVRLGGLSGARSRHVTLVQVGFPVTFRPTLNAICRRYA